jgi:ABC-2 type transport system ATP-binding protein
MKSVIEVEHFTRTYGDFVAVDDISFTVEEGALFGFLGSNGAGKSTTINALCTIIAKTTGTMRVNGHDVDTERDLVRNDIGIVFQESTLDARLTVEENLRYHCEFYGVPKDIVPERIDAVLDLVEMREWRNATVGGLSGGMKRRVEIARALVHSPKVLFLDEPTAGLDPQARASVWDYISRVRAERGVTVFLTTHYMDEAEICSEICIMSKGKIAARGSPAELERRFAQSTLEVETDSPEDIFNFLSDEDIPFEVEKGIFRIATNDVGTELDILDRFRDSIRSFATDRGSLDDVFLAIAGERPAVVGELKEVAR